jgi:hypothetical protein
MFSNKVHWGSTDLADHLSSLGEDVEEKVIDIIEPSSPKKNKTRSSRKRKKEMEIIKNVVVFVWTHTYI